MNIINTLFYEFGSYGPIFIFVSSLYFLWNYNNLFFYYILGIFINSILNIILKTIIQQPRPSIDEKEFILALKNSKRFLLKDGLPFDIFGMPSGHAQLCIFSTVFVYLALKKTNILYLYLLFSIIIISQRVVYNFHTIPQVIIGSFVGAGMAYFMYNITQNKIKGQIKEKADDYGPL